MRAHVARVKRYLRIIRLCTKRFKNYLFKVGPVERMEGTDLLTGIVDLFEEGAKLGKNVMNVTGRDVAAFCDDLIKESRIDADIDKESMLKR